MKILMNVIFLIIMLYESYRFGQLMIKMKQKHLLPTTNEELVSIRKYPQEPVEIPTFSKQKFGISVYGLMLLFFIVMLIIAALNKNLDWHFYLLFLLPFTYSQNLLNVFAIVDDGLLNGSRFVAWDKIKSFSFVQIDTNHKFYGYDKEVNNGYELKMKTKFIPISCIITSDRMKEKITKVLCEHGIVNIEELKNEKK
ncbi:hypothetical protein ACWM35_18565 [Neobacillus sp. K501]